MRALIIVCLLVCLVSSVAQAGDLGKILLGAAIGGLVGGLAGNDHGHRHNQGCGPAYNNGCTYGGYAYQGNYQNGYGYSAPSYDWGAYGGGYVQQYRPSPYNGMPTGGWPYYNYRSDRCGLPRGY